MSQVNLRSVYKIYPCEKGGDVTAVRDFNLDGKNGLAAAPFRSDEFPLITEGKCYP